MKGKQYPGQRGIAFVECPITRVEIRSADGTAREEYEIAVASEYVVERNFFGINWREQLSMTPDAVQLGRFQSGNAPLLVDHETRDQAGVIRSARVDGDKVLRVRAVFGDSARAQEIKHDVDTKVRNSISVGYLPKRWQMVEDDAQKGELWRALLWEPVEASIVPIPADPTVGVGRSVEAGYYPSETVEEGPMLNRGVRLEQATEGGAPAPGGGAPPAARVATVEAAPPTPAAPKRDRNAEIMEITELCEANGATINREWIAENLPPAEYGLRLLKSRATRGVSQPAAERVAAEMSERDASKYSLARAIRIAAGMRGIKDSDVVDKRDGLEWEIHREIEKDLPAGYQEHGGIYVPLRLGQGGVQKRALDTLTGTKGAELVFERPGDLIELLRATAVFLRMGARTLTGISGPVAFPKQTGAMTMYWMAENPSADVTATDITFGLTTLNLKAVMGATSYSRQLLAQAPSSGIDVENMVRSEFAIGHGLEIDRVGFHGLGTQGQPTGLFLTPDVLNPDFSTKNWANLVKFISNLAAGNAQTAGNGWVTTPEVAGTLMSTLKDSVAGAAYLWEGTIENGTLAGYRAMASNQISKTLDDNLVHGASTKHGIAYGDWSQAIVGMGGAMELVVDPYELKRRAMIAVASFQMIDVIFRHGESFAVDAITP